MNYLTLDGIRAAFAKHLMIHLDYDEEDAQEAVNDFPNPYANPYLLEEQVDDVEIDGVGYQKYSDYTDLSRCGVDDVPFFCFYTLYRMEDLKTTRVIDYINARKLYQVDNLDMDDFPADEDDD